MSDTSISFQFIGGNHAPILSENQYVFCSENSCRPRIKRHVHFPTRSPRKITRPEILFSRFMPRNPHFQKCDRKFSIAEDSNSSRTRMTAVACSPSRVSGIFSPHVLGSRPTAHQKSTKSGRWNFSRMPRYRLESGVPGGLTHPDEPVADDPNPCCRIDRRVAFSQTTGSFFGNEIAFLIPGRSGSRPI